MISTEKSLLKDRILNWALKIASYQIEVITSELHSTCKYMTFRELGKPQRA